MIASLALTVALSASPRLALSVGSNVGAPGHDQLWFAESDARRFADALVELGRFAADDVTVLNSPNSAQLTAALERLVALAGQSAAEGQSPLVIFYYSGHANPTAFELGSERFTYTQLSKALAGLPPGVQVAILDACHSGAMTQVKGARPAPLAFEVARDSADGLAVITSSSAYETAQESAQLGGSFFTHHLLIGLRGAADANHDRRVTLDEAYRYAYNRTLTATSASGAEPQHPTWSMRMSGKGELVLVDLRESRSMLALPAGEGRSYLLSQEGGREVVGELSSGTERIVVALPAGRYHIDRLAPTRLTGGIVLVENAVTELDDTKLTAVSASTVGLKGDEVRARYRPSFYVGTEVSIASPILKNFGPGYGVGLSARYDFSQFTGMLGVAYAQKLVDDAGVHYRYHQGTLTLGLAARVQVAPAALLFGGRAGLAYAVQQVDGGPFANDFIVFGGPIIGVMVPIAEHFAARTLVGGTASTFQLNGVQVARFSVDLSLAVEWGP